MQKREFIIHHLFPFPSHDHQLMVFTVIYIEGEINQFSVYLLVHISVADLKLQDRKTD